MRITIHDDFTVEFDNSAPESVLLRADNVMTVSANLLLPCSYLTQTEWFDLIPSIKSFSKLDGVTTEFMYRVILKRRGMPCDIYLIRRADGVWSGKIYNLNGNSFDFTPDKHFSVRANAQLKLMWASTPQPSEEEISLKETLLKMGAEDDLTYDIKSFNSVEALMADLKSDDSILVGDTVQLRSGGPHMTVKCLCGDGDVEVIWHNKHDEPRYTQVPITGLTLIRRSNV